MKNELVLAYQTQMKKLFDDTRTDFEKKSFGLKAVIIEKTIPLMLLEGRRESGKDDLPLLGEAVKNIIMATSVLMFGWDKACALHLRVALENILYGVNIYSDDKLKKQLGNDEEIAYIKVSKLISNFIVVSPASKVIADHFSLANLITDTYSRLSKWSHTLGSEFCSALPILGYQNLTGKNVVDIKKIYDNIAKIAVLVYVTSCPSLLSDFNKSDQRKLLAPLSLSERKFMRETLAV